MTAISYHLLSTEFWGEKNMPKANGHPVLATINMHSLRTGSRIII